MMVVWMLVSLLLFALPVHAGPMQVEADTLMVDHLAGRAEFKGHVKVTRDDFHMQAGRLLLFYAQGAEASKRGGLQRVEAYDGVSMMQGEKQGHADKAVYDESSGVLTLQGHAEMKEPGRELQGESIVHDTRTQKTQVQQAEGQRVKLVIEAEGLPGEAEKP